MRAVHRLRQRRERVQPGPKSLELRPSRWKAKFAVLFLLLASCMPPRGSSVPKEGQRKAMQIVWVDEYQRFDPAPTVLWVEPADQDCIDPASGLGGFTWLGACHEGLTLTPFETRISWHEGETYSHGEPFAHELWHVVDARRGVFDLMHRGAAWGPTGIVEEANQLLRSEGR